MDELFDSVKEAMTYLVERDASTRPLRALLNVQSEGLGHYAVSGILGENFMDAVVGAYREGHFIASIALCRMTSEVTLREYAYFRWLLTNRTKEIQDFVKKEFARHSPEYCKTCNNLENKFRLKYFEDNRYDLNEVLRLISHDKMRKELYRVEFGSLIDFCDRNQWLEKNQKELASFINQKSNDFIHGKYFLPPQDPSNPYKRPQLTNEPNIIAFELLEKTSKFVNGLFVDYL